MEEMKKSLNSESKVPSNGKWADFEAVARASVGVFPGFALAPLLVPSQSWVPPEGVVTSCPLEKTKPSKIVVVEPSMRRETFWRSAFLQSLAVMTC